MTLTNKKVDCGDHIDRISDLPNNVIDCILQHLDIYELVRTSILSRKWKYIWTSVTQLDFDFNFFNKCKHLEARERLSIITEVLLLHNGPVDKFSLSSSWERFELLNKWILFLSRNGIKELQLVNLPNWGYFNCQMPSHVFSCLELTYLRIGGIKLSVPPPNFEGFKCLLELHVNYIRFEIGALKSLISGCPLLENLTILCCHSECIDISAPALKVLYMYFDRVAMPICLKNAKNLIDLTLQIHPNVRWPISELIKSLPKIKRLVMTPPCCHEFLEAGTISLAQHTSFSSLEYLEFSLCFNEREIFFFIAGVLKSAPNLLELVIECNYVSDNTQVPDHLEELECFDCCLSHLQRVTIKLGFRSQRIMSFIRFILANSPSLLILTFDVGIGWSQSDAPILLSISRDLLLMKRASQRAQVKVKFESGGDFPT